MRERFGFVLAAVTGVCGLLVPNPASGDENGEAARGEYLVRHVAMCVQCHTPKDEEGRLVEEELLMGAPIPVASPYRDREWATEAPAIAGLPGGYAREDLVRFLVTGVTKSGRRPMPPMPPFRMKREDARDVAAYLASLERPSPGGE